MNIWSAISSKKFFQALLDLLRTKDIPEVQMKLLGLIQKWGLNFKNKKNVSFEKLQDLYILNLSENIISEANDIKYFENLCECINCDVFYQDVIILF